MFIDARIPVRFRETMPRPALPEAALIVLEGDDQACSSGWAAVCALPDGVPSAHPPSCRCCASRSAQAAALTRLFHQRARGETGFFRLLIACLPPTQAAGLRTALMEDMFVSRCFVEQH